MSIFSRLRQSKKAAQEHKAKTSKQINSEELPKVPYKHVPSHAAVDALSGAPSSWKNEDRPKILEHHKRRSMMGLSRAGSALSTRTWNDQGSTQGSTPGSHTPAVPVVPPMMRNSSYNSYNPSWNDRGDRSYLNEPYNHRRKRPSRNHSFIDSGIGPSPLASTSASNRESPTSSSSNSSLTDDNLEIPRKTKPSKPVSYAQADILDRLHTSTTRKLGEAPIGTSPFPSRASTAPPAAAAPEKQPKKRWSLKGKSREVAVAS